MARRRDVAPVEFTHGAPPEELLRFVPVVPGRWTADDFAAFLRARAAWRNNHLEPLPRLISIDRARARAADIPEALAEAEFKAGLTAPNPPFQAAGPVANRPATPVAWSHAEPEKGQSNDY